MVLITIMYLVVLRDRRQAGWLYYDCLARESFSRGLGVEIHRNSSPALPTAASPPRFPGSRRRGSRSRIAVLSVGLGAGPPAGNAALAPASHRPESSPPCIPGPPGRETVGRRAETPK